MYGNYKKDLEYGQRKENVTLNVLRAQYGVNGIIDNQENKHDIILENSCICEVKADRFIKNTGNIWLEIIGNIKANKEGWFIYCDCQLLAYHVVEPSEPYRTIKIIFFDFVRLKQYVKDNYFDSDFNNTVSVYANAALKENEKAILLPEDEYRPFIISEFSTLKKKEIFRNPKNSSLKDFTDFIGDFYSLQA